MIAIIGSNALKYWIKEGEFRVPNDLDILGTYNEIDSFLKTIRRKEKLKSQYPFDNGKKIFAQTDKRIIEAEIAWDDSNSESLKKLIEEDGQMIEFEGFKVLVAPLNLLYTLKMSHRYLKDSPHFLKTMHDIRLMRKMGAFIPEKYENFYKERQAIQYDYSLPKLNQSKKDFFSGDGIVYKYDHDTLHEALKFKEKPAYSYYTVGEVWSSKEKFNECSEEIKLLGVLEESLVLACERSQLAFQDRPTPLWSFEYALFKVCTSITSGWFREYAWENYEKVIELYHKIGTNYVETVEQAIKNGIVKPFKNQ